ncbi:MAG TPA: ABC transporter substrate-binding protein [Casimicrobiaceae bacterium]|nr:ABC transporter substrate-binding protein [Casimicrobiaceae bacterium]
MRSIRLAGIALTFAVGCAWAQIPPAGYPSSYAETIAAARKEGRVVVHATTDVSAATPLVRAFESLYPDVKVDYQELESPDLYGRFVADRAAHRPSADVLWSSAMDLQLKLVNDGHAQAYASPEAGALPEWAVWKTEAFGTTFEPVGFLYNERLLSASEVPQSHADFARLLKERPDRFRGKVITYDIERAGVGFLFATQDSRATPGFWQFAKLLGDTDARFEASTAAMMEAVGRGQVLLGYNVIGSYAIARAKMDPAIGFVLPKDYALVLSRVAIIAKGAPHPNAARLWLDFLLSQGGQSLLATKSGLLSVRSDLASDLTAAGLAKTLGAAMRPIGVGPGLLVYLDRAKRQEFVKQWREAVSRGSGAGGGGSR